jgi:hypothetical protein
MPTRAARYLGTAGHRVVRCSATSTTGRRRPRSSHSP